MTKAIYPGSFDPFTNGHLDICKKASELFDEVCVVIAVNAQKQRTFSSEGMKDAIEQDLLGNGITNCSVYICYGLVAKFAEEIGAKYMIRGLRNNMDYNYEENIAEVNKLINPLMEYVFLLQWLKNCIVIIKMFQDMYHAVHLILYAIMER